MSFCSLGFQRCISYNYATDEWYFDQNGDGVQDPGEDALGGGVENVVQFATTPRADGIVIASAIDGLVDTVDCEATGNTITCDQGAAGQQLTLLAAVGDAGSFTIKAADQLNGAQLLFEANSDGLDPNAVRNGGRKCFSLGDPVHGDQRY